MTHHLYMTAWCVYEIYAKYLNQLCVVVKIIRTIFGFLLSDTFNFYMPDHLIKLSALHIK